MKVMVVDDEPLARQRLRRMLETLPDCEIVAEAGNGAEAVELWRQTRPSLVLMDIRMPGMDGLEAAQELSRQDTPPAIIFCTAYNDYALEAFDASAVGYLLKPVSRDKLVETMEKAQQLNQVQLAALEKSEASSGDHISARNHTGVELIAIDDVRYFLADQKYVTVFHRGGEVLIDETLKELEQRFDQQLLRVHRNALVAVKAIRGLDKAEEGYRVRLVDIDQGPVVSRRHLPSVKALLEKL